jgi:hypothetical protein
MLLVDDDYEYLKSCGLEHVEDEGQRYFVFRTFPLPPEMYCHDGVVLTAVNVLVRIPANYNTTGTDMLWLNPPLMRKDGKGIPAAHTFGNGDPSHFEGQEYCRWSRHYAADSWKAGIDGVRKIISRIDWALRNPDADQPKS